MMMMIIIITLRKRSVYTVNLSSNLGQLWKAFAYRKLWIERFVISLSKNDAHLWCFLGRERKDRMRHNEGESATLYKEVHV